MLIDGILEVVKVNNNYLELEKMVKVAKTVQVNSVDFFKMLEDNAVEFNKLYNKPLKVAKPVYASDYGLEELYTPKGVFK